VRLFGLTVSGKAAGEQDYYPVGSRLMIFDYCCEIQQLGRQALFYTCKTVSQDAGQIAVQKENGKNGIKRVINGIL
jgi:hypothetical protein